MGRLDGGLWSSRMWLACRPMRPALHALWSARPVSAARFTAAVTYHLQAELREQSAREQGKQVRDLHRLRGLQHAPAAAGVGQEAAGRASAAADPPSGEAQHQQQHGRRQQGQQQCGCSSVGGGTEEAPGTPRHLALAPTQQQHTSSEEEQYQRQGREGRGAAAAATGRAPVAAGSMA